MPHCRHWAEKLLRELPDDPEALLLPARRGVSRNYADPGFLQIFFDWLDEQILQDPQDGLRWAKVVPRLALVTPGNESASQDPLLSYHDNLAKAHAILGGAYRATSQHEAAQEEYLTAFRIASSKTISEQVYIDLLRRYSYLLISQGRPEEALDLLDTLLTSYEKPSLEQSRTLVPRGYTLVILQRFSEAVDCFGEVLKEVNPKESSVAKRTHHAAVHNMAYAVQQEGGSVSCWMALGYVGRAKRLLKQPGLPLHSLQWVEGLIWRNLQKYDVRTGFSLTDEAERALQRALHGFLTLRAPWEIALVGLDLATLYRSLGKWQELVDLALDTLQRFCILSGNTQAIAALQLLVNASQARKGVETAIVAAQKIIRAKVQQGAKGKSLTRTTRTSAQATNAPPPIGRSNVAMVETRKSLLQAAYEMIGDGFRVAEILKHARIPRTTFYHQFRDREGCALAVVDEHMRGMVLDWLRQLDQADEPLDALASLLTEAPPMIASPAPEYRQRLRERIDDVYHLWCRGLARNMARAQQEGTVRDDAEPKEIAAQLIASCSGLGAQDPHCVRGILWYLDTLRPTRWPSKHNA